MPDIFQTVSPDNFPVAHQVNTILAPRYILKIELTLFLYLLSCYPHRSGFIVLPPAISAGHEGAPVHHQQAQVTQTPAPEQDPVGPTPPEHAGPAGHPATAPALSGEAEAVPAPDPHK